MREREYGCTLNICEYGIAQRAEDGTVVIIRPGANGSKLVEVEVDRDLADRFNIVTGDVVEGPTEPIPELSELNFAPVSDLQYGWDDDERDEPAAVRGETVPEWLVTRRTPTEKLVDVERINSLPAAEALERPASRIKRSSYERSLPDRWVPLSHGPSDLTGRMLDFAAPLGLGYAGIVYGPHGAGMTRTLQSLARGITESAPECLLFALLIRARGEEVTDWRRRFPRAEVVVCPGGLHRTAFEETVRVADVTLAAAQRMTELGRHVALVVDSLTALWAAMLEGEEADSQREADRAWSRRRIREWLQAAGCFGGEGLLGSGLGGSLTILGTVWSRSVDTEAEEEGETHPHLRLLEHALPESDWRVALSGSLSADRHYPAIDTDRCLSSREERIVPEALLDRVRVARSRLAGLGVRERYNAQIDAMAETRDLDEMVNEIIRLTDRP